MYFKEMVQFSQTERVSTEGERKKERSNYIFWEKKAAKYGAIQGQFYINPIGRPSRKAIK